MAIEAMIIALLGLKNSTLSGNLQTYKSKQH